MTSLPSRFHANKPFAREVFLGQLLDNEHLIVAIKDIEGRYLHISRRLAQIYEEQGIDAIGHTALEALPREMAETINRDDREVIKEAKQQVYEQTFDLGGVQRTFLSTRFVLRDEDGSVCGLCVIGSEITERKRLEEALRNAAIGVSGSTGENVFAQMVRYLATTLDIDFAFISSIENAEATSARTVAVYHDGRFLDDFDYQLADTPCFDVIGKQFSFIADDLAQHYPADLVLIKMGIVSYAAYPLFDSRRQPVGLIAIGHSRPLEDRDLTESMLRIFAERAAAELERRQAESALRASEEQYRGIFNASVDGMALFTLEGSLVDCNPAWAKMHGHDEALRNVDPRLFVPPESHDQFERFRTEVAAGRPFHAEAPGQRLDGSRFLADVRGVRIDYRGAPHMLAIVRDITERKQRETALRKSEDRHRATVAAALDCIVSMDASGNIIEFNPAAEACFGHRREEVLGLPLADTLIPERDRAAHRAGLARHMSGEHGPMLGRRIEVSALRADGSEFPAELAIAVAQGPEGDIFIGYLRDITVVKQADEDRERLERQLRQAQKMEAIGHLTGGIAHDFNNILTSILGYAVMAEEHTTQDGTERIGHYVEQIRRSGERARDLIAQMLTFSRGQRGEPRPLAIAPLIKESVKLFGSTFPSSVVFQTDLEPRLPHVTADPIQVEQVLMNLCINARDAMAGSGQIEISLHHRHAVDLVCTACRLDVRGEFVELAVRDSGSGIDPKTIDRIFEPFFSTKGAAHGSGMGLATTHGIVHDHGGHVVVESPAESGALFRVLLPPTTKDGAAETAEATTTVGPDTARSGHILLVDDEQSVRQFMSDYLENRGYTVHEAIDGHDALSRFDASPPYPDLVITDQTMPGMSGIELAQALGKRPVHVPVILYTGYSEQVSEQQVDDAGVDGYLKKPLDLRELNSLLDSLLPS